MSAWSQSNEQRRKEAFWRTKPPDPTRSFAKSGVPYHARRSITAAGGRVLMPSDFMPTGPHTGKHLHQVPTDYLLWVNAQPWSKRWHPWQPVASFISRFLLDASDSEFVVHASACSGQANAPACPTNSTPTHSTPTIADHQPLFYLNLHTGQFYTLPGHEDLLQTLAAAVLHQQPRHYHTGAPPHYLITQRQITTIERLPHVQKVTPRDTSDHRAIWIQYFQSRPQLPQ